MNLAGSTTRQAPKVNVLVSALFPSLLSDQAVLQHSGQKLGVRRQAPKVSTSVKLWLSQIQSLSLLIASNT